MIMKKIVLILIWVLPFIMMSQTKKENYIHTVIYQTETKESSDVSNDKKIEQIHYYDGLGNKKQSISIRKGGDQEDIIQHHEYDKYGRKNKEYLPYALPSQGGELFLNPENDIQQFYNTQKYENTTNPYREYVFESSPLSRVIETAAPGNDWKYDPNNVSFNIVKPTYHNLYIPLHLKDVCSNNLGSEKGYIRIENNTLTFSFNGSCISGALLKTGKIKQLITSPTELPDIELGILAMPGGLLTNYNARIKNNYLEFYKTNNATITVSGLYVNNKTVDLSTLDYSQISYLSRTSSNNTLKNEFLTNEKQEVIKFDVGFLNDNTESPYLKNNGFYNRNQLFKTLVRGENWRPNQQNKKDHTIEEFTDQQGRLILKRMYNKNIPHDTYYVYDKFNNLTFVLPPKVKITANIGISQNEINALCYQYKYDYRNRLVEKKIPGKGWEYIIYDKLDRPILTQDARMREQTPKQWAFTKYDVFSRIIYSGLILNNRNRNEIQNDYNTLTLESELNEERTNTAQIVGGTKLFYSNYAEPSRIYKVFTINYYDDYMFNLPENFSLPSNIYEQELHRNPKTRLTASKVLVLGTNKWITSLNYYDTKNRLIYTYNEDEYSKSTTTVQNKLGFTDNTLENKIIHSKEGKTPITTINKFEYDHMGRLISHKQKINTQAEEQIVYNTYDELGRMIKKDVGGGADGLSNVFKDKVNIKVEKNTITKTNNSILWDAGLATVKNLKHDGYITFEATQTNNIVIVGLSDQNLDTSFSSIDYGIYLEGNQQVKVMENGVKKGYLKGNNTGITYETGDLFKVERINNTIHYKKNGKIFYTSTIPSTGNLVGDISISNFGGSIKNVELREGLQTIDYTYNIRGWLTNINNVNDFSTNDLFALDINYNDANHGGHSLYNGNISETSWITANDDKQRWYTYQYDALDRIIKGIDNTGNYAVSGINYDKNGNLLSLKRNGWQNNTTYNNMDNLVYSYDSGNKLTKVVDRGNIDYGFKDGINTNDDYQYDSNGNMILDRNKGISSIKYNYKNLPYEVSIKGKTINYTYDATGKKLLKAAGNIYTNYDGNYIYKNGELQFFNHAQGYVEPNANGGFDYIYQYKDHQDNIRLSYADNDNDGKIDITKNSKDVDGDNDFNNEIREEKNYYPFGLQHKGYNNTVKGRKHAYGFGGKEEQHEYELNWIDITARNYDPALGRWMNLDPLAEEMRRHSPYNYAFNNPIYFIDPDGMMPEPRNKTQLELTTQLGRTAKDNVNVFLYSQPTPKSKGKPKPKSITIPGKNIQNTFEGFSIDDESADAIAQALADMAEELSGVKVSKYDIDPETYPGYDFNSQSITEAIKNFLKGNLKDQDYKKFYFNVDVLNKDLTKKLFFQILSSDANLTAYFSISEVEFFANDGLNTSQSEGKNKNLTVTGKQGDISGQFTIGVKSETRTDYYHYFARVKLFIGITRNSEHHSRGTNIQNVGRHVDIYGLFQDATNYNDLKMFYK